MERLGVTVDGKEGLHDFIIPGWAPVKFADADLSLEPEAGASGSDYCPAPSRWKSIAIAAFTSNRMPGEQRPPGKTK
jgi:hypothetical protein